MTELSQVSFDADYRRPESWPTSRLVDSDVHITVPRLAALLPYLDRRWQDYIRESGMGDLSSSLYPTRTPNVYLPATTPENGLPGSSLDLTRRQLLDPWQTDIAVVNCSYAVDSLHNDDLAAAVATAANRWQLEEWLQQDARLRGSALLPVQNIELAVAEVERVAQHRQFVQVLLPSRSREPLGRRGYWPIFAAAQRHGLTVGIQAGGVSGNPTTPVGWASSLLEDYVDLAQAFQAQVLSLVSEGVFTQFPDLRVVLIEGGFTWLPSLMWRFDKNWKGLRREVPWVKALPSQVIREHVRLTIQPLDEPDEPRFLADVVAQIDAEDMLLFATDYPHLQFHTAEVAMPTGLPEHLQTKILGGNAAEVYHL